MEGETGIANAIVRPALFERRRLTLTHEAYLVITGRMQHQEDTIHIRAERVDPLPYRRMAHAGSHDFH